MLEGTVRRLQYAGFPFRKTGKEDIRPNLSDLIEMIEGKQVLDRLEAYYAGKVEERMQSKTP